jgi:hypothetical protein
MHAGTEACRYIIGSGRNEHVVRTDDADLSGVRTVWHVVRTTRTVDRWAPGRLTGNLNSSNLQTEPSDITLNSGIHVYSILQTSVFVQTQNEANKTNKLPL